MHCVCMLALTKITARRSKLVYHNLITQHVHILADLVTSSISQLEKLVSGLAALLARAPKRIRLEKNRLLVETTCGQHRLQIVALLRSPGHEVHFNLIVPRLLQ